MLCVAPVVLDAHPNHGTGAVGICSYAFSLRQELISVLESSFPPQSIGKPTHRVLGELLVLLSLAL